MNNEFIINGFVVKSYDENPIYRCINNYNGIGKYIAWPLNFQKDSTSIQLTIEADERWFGYQDVKMWVVPDVDYLKRYTDHCKELDIDIHILQIESFENNVISNFKPEILEVLGFEYIDTDMDTSCIYSDVFDYEHYSETAKKQLNNFFGKLNKNGLANTFNDINTYIDIRKHLMKTGFESEEFFNPFVAKLSRIIFNDT